MSLFHWLDPIFIQGITFSPNMLVVPTKKAHILLEYAAKEGKQHELQEVRSYCYATFSAAVPTYPWLPCHPHTPTVPIASNSVLILCCSIGENNFSDKNP